MRRHRARHAPAAVKSDIRALGAAAGLVAGTFAGVLPAQAANYPLAAPAQLHATGATQTTLSLDWDSVATAPGYRVMLSEHPTMGRPSFHRFVSSTGTINNLLPAHRYFFRVAVIDPVTGTRLSRYSPTADPSASTLAMHPPSNLRVTDASTTTLALAWSPPAGAVRYQVLRSTSADMAGSVSAITKTPALLTTGLSVGTAYYFQVRVVNTSGTGLTPYLPAFRAATDAIAPVTGDDMPLRTASFNLFGVNNDSHASGNMHVWRERRPGVVAATLGEHVDVMGLQEANQSTIYASALPDGTNQYLDLKIALNKAGGHYALANEYAYNCVRPNTSRNCVYQDRGASNGTRILYNADRLTLLDNGSFKYVHQSSGKTDRYLAWAKLQSKVNGRTFLFTSTHLDPYSPSMRVEEWKELIAKINALKGNLPVVAVGDFNSSKWDDYARTMLPAMRSAGYGDVLNQIYATSLLPSPRAERTINGWVSSYNAFRSDVKPFSYDENKAKTDNSIDWVSRRTRCGCWSGRPRRNSDPTSYLIRGVIPSDHGMVRATLVLPGGSTPAEPVLAPQPATRGAEEQAPHGLAVLGRAGAPTVRQRRYDLQTTPVLVVGIRAQLTGPERVTVPDLDHDLVAVGADPEVHRKPPVAQGVGDQLARDQHRVLDDLVRERLTSEVLGDQRPCLDHPLGVAGIEGTRGDAAGPRGVHPGDQHCDVVVRTVRHQLGDQPLGGALQFDHRGRRSRRPTRRCRPPGRDRDARRGRRCKARPLGSVPQLHLVLLEDGTGCTATQGRVLAAREPPAPALARSEQRWHGSAFAKLSRCAAGSKTA